MKVAQLLKTMMACSWFFSLTLYAGSGTPQSAQCASKQNATIDFSNYGLKILSLWVSHGDATLTYLPNGELALVDTGQDFAVKDYLPPFLQQHGVKQLDYFIVTHYHGDHMAGKIEKDGKVFLGYRYDEEGPRIPVKNFWDYKTFRRGDIVNWGGTQLFILNSFYENEWSSDENNKSLSFYLEWSGFTYALGGDIYANEQDRILKDFPEKVRVHAYRTNHHLHGSVSWDYLKAADPVIFITSAESAVYQREAYTKILGGVIGQLKEGGHRLQESLLTLENGNVLIGANSDKDWSYGCLSSGTFIPALAR